MSVPLPADIVVAGSGTGAAVLASRLASASMSVVAMEAGPDPGRAGSPTCPADLIDADRVGTSHDWGYSGPAADRRVLAFPRARIIGTAAATMHAVRRMARGLGRMAAIGRGWASSSIERLDPAAMPAKGSLGREVIEAGAGSPQDLPGEVALGGEGPDCVS